MAAAQAPGPPSSGATGSGGCGDAQPGCDAGGSAGGGAAGAGHADGAAGGVARRAVRRLAVRRLTVRWLAIRRLTVRRAAVGARAVARRVRHPLGPAAAHDRDDQHDQPDDERGCSQCQRAEDPADLRPSEHRTTDRDLITRSRTRLADRLGHDRVRTRRRSVELVEGLTTATVDVIREVALGITDRHVAPARSGHRHVRRAVVPAEHVGTLVVDGPVAVVEREDVGARHANTLEVVRRVDHTDDDHHEPHDGDTTTHDEDPAADPVAGRRWLLRRRRAGGRRGRGHLVGPWGPDGLGHLTIVTQGASRRVDQSLLDQVEAVVGLHHGQPHVTGRRVAVELARAHEHAGIGPPRSRPAPRRRRRARAPTGRTHPRAARPRRRGARGAAAHGRGGRGSAPAARRRGWSSPHAATAAACTGPGTMKPACLRTSLR